MAYLLDTCLISELWKPRPDAGVLAWLGDVVEDELFLSALTLGELRKGIARLDEGRRKRQLLRDYGRLRDRFGARVLEIDAATTERWGDLTADVARAGGTLHVVDGLLAATALVHGLSLVTRNTADFAHVPIPIEDPWTSR